MSDLIPFELEDFFDEYEHIDHLINVTSSDAQPWNWKEFSARLGNWTKAMPATFSYPNPKALIPSLESAFPPRIAFSALPTAGGEESIAIVMHWLASSQRVRSIGLPTPTYGAFRGWARLLNLEIKLYDYKPELNWAPDPEKLRNLAAVCDSLIFVNPHNPTGHSLTRSEILPYAEILEARGKILVVDEIFAIRGDENSLAYLSDNIVVLGSLSKMYGLPGLRLGWILASKLHLKALRTVQQYITLSPSVFTTATGGRVLAALEEFSRADLVMNNRQLVKKWAEANAELVSISPAMGGTTVLLEISGARTEDDLFKSFLRSRLLLVPGRCFDLPKRPARFRLGYGMKTTNLRRGLKKIIATLTQKRAR